MLCLDTGETIAGSRRFKAPSPGLRTDRPRD
jgi:hypothetical protein